MSTFFQYNLKRQISNGRKCSENGIKHVMFVKKKKISVTTNSVGKRNTARLTGTPTRRQIVRDISFFFIIYLFFLFFSYFFFLFFLCYHYWCWHQKFKFKVSQYILYINKYIFATHACWWNLNKVELSELHKILNV